MTTDIWFAYLGAILLLMTTPGPSQLLMLSNSMRFGAKRSSLTALGDLTANALQMVISAVGLASILYTSQTMFLVIKWLGVAYLIYMGIQQFRKPIQATDDTIEPTVKHRKDLFLQGFVTSASNPKAIIFFAALFPQFINPRAEPAGQFLILGLTYLVIDGCFLMVYGVFASWIRRQFQARIAPYLNKIAGGFLILAAVLLGLKPVEVD